MEKLFALQTLQLKTGSTKGTQEAEMEGIRKAIPAPILAHYDRLLARDKKGVAVVRNGVCTECHIRVAIGALASLAQEDDIQVCGNCGRYLFLPANEPVIPVSTPPPAAVKPARRKKTTLAHAD
jgi:predicted  nucleic acid-binding Zn-ribbon protein